LTVRQELKRFQRKGLGYSKDLETHKRAVALHFGVYNFVRQHHTLGTTLGDQFTQSDLSITNRHQHRHMDDLATGWQLCQTRQT
jgi:hypothetical protein